MITAICFGQAAFAQTVISPWGANELAAQTGTNWAYYSVTIPAGYNGFVLTASSVPITGSGTIQLFVHAGTVNPTEVDYLTSSSTGILELGSGLLSPGEYRIGMLFRGATSASSATNHFRLIPVLSPFGGALTNRVANGRDLYFRLTAPAAYPGLRAVLSKTNHAGTELSILRGSLPESATLVRSAVGAIPETVWMTDTQSTTGDYFLRIAGLAPGTNTISLHWEQGFAKTLAWDPGAADAGTQVVSNAPNDPGGMTFLRINAQASVIGAWRTVLRVTSGSAEFYIQNGGLPGNPLSGNPGVHAGTTPDSARLFYDGQYSAGQDWYITVNAAPGSQWTLFSGEAYSQQLGNVLPPDPSPNNMTIADTNTATIGPEGVRFFRTVVTNGTAAWRVWANDGGPTPVTLTNYVEVRQTRVPVPGSTYDLRQRGQMLVVPPYPNQANIFFIGVSGTNGAPLNVDSRVQRIDDLAFGDSTNGLLNGFRYRTFRVQVPVDQIGWQINAKTITGDADVALQRASVGNEFHYLALSAADGGVGDSITIVSPTLSDDAYFITIYGKTQSQFSLSQGNPEVTKVPFVNSPAVVPGYTYTKGPIIVNDLTNANRNGWRYYVVTNLDSQLGVLGWFLQLSNQSPNTEIALRRNALPARWSTGAHLDYSSTTGFMERQDHQADVWYIGINSPVLPLGKFHLETRPFLPTLIDPESTSEIAVTGQQSGSWHYFELNVTNALDDTNFLALEIQLTNTSGDGLSTWMRRDVLPYNVSGTLNSGNNTWASGNSVGGGGDWSFRARPNGNADYMFLPMGWPLQPGHYYFGVFNSSGQIRDYGLRFSRVGAPGTGREHEVIEIADTPGVVAAEGNLSPRDFRIYHLKAPDAARMLRLQLNVTNGEARMFIRRNHLPGLPGAIYLDPFYDTHFVQIARQGSEEMNLLPQNLQTNIPAGDYYILVAAEGALANYGGSGIGTGPSGYELSILPEFASEYLGVFSPGDLLVIETNFIPVARKFYTLDVQPGVKALELRLENLSGNSRVQWAYGDALLASDYNYGWMGGSNGYTHITGVLNLIPPTPGRYSFVIESTTSASVSNALRLTITAEDSSPLAAEGGDISVTNQPPQSWRFFQVDVPATAGGSGLAAWDVRLQNVSNDGVQMWIGHGNFPNGTSDDQLPSVWTTWGTNDQVAGDFYLSRRRQGNGYYNKELHLGWGWPIQAGSYFVGVFNAASAPASYDATSRLIGDSASSLPKKVENLTWGAPGALATVSNLPAGEARYFRLPIPANTPMLRLHLTQLKGEARMTLRRGSVPGTHLYPGDLNSDLDWYAAAYARVGDEEMSTLPLAGTNTIPAGDYFITVISEGEHPPDTTTLGTNTVDLRIERLPDIGVTDLGTLAPNVTLQFTNVTTWPNRTYYRLTIPEGARSLRIATQNLTNGSTLFIRPGTNWIAGLGPVAPNQLSFSRNTWSGGEGPLYSPGTGGWPNPLTLTDPAPGVYTLLVDVGNNTTAASIVTFDLTGETPLDFANGNILYTNAGQTWRYFRVDVPTNAATELGVRGWEVRLADSPSDESWTLQIRRDQLPPLPQGANTYVNDNSTSWPSGYVYGGSAGDWTGRGIPGMANTGFFASMAWGRPLEPGTYYIGVYNGSASPRTIRLQSRAIGIAGSGLPIEIEEWTNFTTLAINNQPADTFRYFHLNLTNDIPAMKFTLHATQGDARWWVRREFVPGIWTAAADLTLPGNQVKTAVPGNDYMVWWPQAPVSTLPGGDYYFIVASEGAPSNPDNGLIGTGNSSCEISSELFAPENLGTVSLTNELVRDASYDAGEPLAYEFTVPPGAPALEVRLENRVGNPVFRIGRGAGLSSDDADWFGRNSTNDLAGDVSYFVLPEPDANRYWISVRHRSQFSGQPPQPGSFQLHVRVVPPGTLNFSSLQNTNGQTNVITGSLADGQSLFFDVDVPESLDGEPVVGWYLKLDSLLGSPRMHVRPGTILPHDKDGLTSSFQTKSLVVAPPYFQPGHWTLEVQAVGDSQFTLTSERVMLERPAWQMPARGEVPATPGVSPPLFADSSVLPDGTPLANDVSLGQDRYHFYAVDVPEGNGGLIRAELLALSGNPDLFVRAGGIPSLEASQPAGQYNYYPQGYWQLALNGSGTEFANWVPVDTKREIQLTPGRWYFMVRASDSNVRYRMTLGLGQVADLAMNGGSASAQNLAANDWRYYRFLVPTNPPQFWNLSVTQQSGNISVFVRDSAPPGAAYGVNPASWATDVKNSGTNYLNGAAPGNWQFTVPQLRPGQDGASNVYYVGIKAASGSQFSIASSTSGSPLSQIYPNLDFIAADGGSVSLTLDPFQRKTWRVRVPDDARRWKTTATNSASVRIYLQNGSVPWASRDNPPDHWSSSTANSQFEQALNNRTNGGWPWIRGETFYIAATNESAIAQPFYLRVDTRAWVLNIAATNGTVQRSPNATYYDDGAVVTLTPQPAPGFRFAGWAGDLSGTNVPKQVTMTSDRNVTALFEAIPYHINITAVNGAVTNDPAASEYFYGNPVTLTAIPDPGYEFVQWTGGISSSANPLQWVVTGDLNLTAVFQPLPSAPNITLEPDDAAMLVGQTATFTASANGFPIPALQWQQSTNSGTTWNNLQNGGGISGATSGTLSLANVMTNLSGSLFRMIATNSQGADQTRAALLTVNVPITFTLQPHNAAATNGQDVTFTAAASGSPAPSYIWQRSPSGSATWNDLAGVAGIHIAGGTLTVSNVSEAMNGDQFRVIASNSVDVAASQVAVLKVGSAAQLFDELLLWLPFAGNANDASGNGRDGIVQGAVLTTNRFGEANSAYAFNGANYIQVNDLDPDDYTNGFSFGAWIEPNASGGAMGWTYDAGWGSTYIVAGGGSVHFRIGTGNPATDRSVSTNVPLGEWTHVFMTHSPTNDSLYLNGQLVGQWASYPMTGNVSNLTIGASYAGNFNGAIDEVAVYGRELSADEVALLFNGVLNGAPPLSPITIVAQPQNLTVTNGDSAGFSVSASSAQTLSYQWRLYGTNLPGQTQSNLTVMAATTNNAGPYTVVIANSSLNVTSDVATLTVLAPAKVLYSPNDLTVASGQDATFAVTAVGTTPLRYTWFVSDTAGGAGVEVPNGTNRTLTIASVGPANAGYYFVHVENDYGQDDSSRALLTVLAPRTGFVTRILPGGYLPGGAFEVQLEVTPDPSLFYYAVADYPPTGWTVGNINEGGTFNLGDGSVRFAFFADNAVRTLRYTLTPPADATGRAQFTGTASADGTDSPIAGADYLDPFLNHPADTNSDFAMTLGEVNAYGNAWLRGLPWPMPPNPIPMSYLTRAGYLQRNGQNYQFDPNVGSAPNWWIVATPKTRLVTRLYDNPNSAGAERAVQQDHVSIQIGNVADVGVFAVQEWLPTGFAAEEISDGGTFDAAASRVRWGPFMDSASRTLSYKVRPPENFAGEIAIAGTLSADGDDSRVNGDDAVTFGSGADRRVLVRMEQGRFKIELRGPLNARVSVETCDHLGDAASWQLLTEFRLAEVGQTWTAPEDSGQSPRFYRVVLKEP